MFRRNQAKATSSTLSHVKAQKNDDLDAEAISEAATRPTIRFAEVKSQAQSDIQALHRARERLVSERTALINHLRALLLERGIVAPQGRRKLEDELSVFADEDGSETVSPRIRVLIEDLRADPFERAEYEANGYGAYIVDHAFLAVPA